MAKENKKFEERTSFEKDTTTSDLVHLTKERPKLQGRDSFTEGNTPKDVVHNMRARLEKGDKSPPLPATKPKPGKRLSITTTKQDKKESKEEEIKKLKSRPVKRPNTDVGKDAPKTKSSVKGRVRITNDAKIEEKKSSSESNAKLLKYEVKRTTSVGSKVKKEQSERKKSIPPLTKPKPKKLSAATTNSSKETEVIETGKRESSKRKTDLSDQHKTGKESKARKSTHENIVSEPMETSDEIPLLSNKVKSVKPKNKTVLKSDKVEKEPKTSKPREMKVKKEKPVAVMKTNNQVTSKVERSESKVKNAKKDKVQREQTVQILNKVAIDENALDDEPMKSEDVLDKPMKSEGNIDEPMESNDEVPLLASNVDKSKEKNNFAFTDEKQKEATLRNKNDPPLSPKPKKNKDPPMSPKPKKEKSIKIECCKESNPLLQKYKAAVEKNEKKIADQQKQPKGEAKRSGAADKKDVLSNSTKKTSSKPQEIKKTEQIKVRKVVRDGDKNYSLLTSSDENINDISMSSSSSINTASGISNDVQLLISREKECSREIDSASLPPTTIESISAFSTEKEPLLVPSSEEEYPISQQIKEKTESTVSPPTEHSVLVLQGNETHILPSSEIEQPLTESVVVLINEKDSPLSNDVSPKKDSRKFSFRETTEEIQDIKSRISLSPLPKKRTIIKIVASTGSEGVEINDQVLLSDEESNSQAKNVSSKKENHSPIIDSVVQSTEQVELEAANDTISKDEVDCHLVESPTSDSDEQTKLLGENETRKEMNKTKSDAKEIKTEKKSKTYFSKGISKISSSFSSVTSRSKENKKNGNIEKRNLIDPDEDTDRVVRERRERRTAKAKEKKASKKDDEKTPEKQKSNGLIINLSMRKKESPVSPKYTKLETAPILSSKEQHSSLSNSDENISIDEKEQTIVSTSTKGKQVEDVDKIINHDVIVPQLVEDKSVNLSIMDSLFDDLADELDHDTTATDINNDISDVTVEVVDDNKNDAACFSVNNQIAALNDDIINDDEYINNDDKYINDDDQQPLVNGETDKVTAETKNNDVVVSELKEQSKEKSVSVNTTVNSSYQTNKISENRTFFEENTMTEKIVPVSYESDRFSKRSTTWSGPRYQYSVQNLMHNRGYSFSNSDTYTPPTVRKSYSVVTYTPQLVRRKLDSKGWIMDKRGCAKSAILRSLSFLSDNKNKSTVSPDTNNNLSRSTKSDQINLLGGNYESDEDVRLDSQMKGNKKTSTVEVQEKKPSEGRLKRFSFGSSKKYSFGK